MRLELTTLKQIRERLIDELQIGYYGLADSVAIGGVTWILRFQNSNWGANQFKGWWGQRPDQTGNDVVKAMTLLNGAVLSHGSANYNDVGANKYFSLTRPDWHPTIYVLPLINRALEKCWQWWRTVITPVQDGDMEATGTTAWAFSGATLSKSTTVVWDGTQSLQVLTTAPGGYAESQVFEVAAQRGFRITAKLRQSAGAGGVLQVVDGVTGALIAQSQPQVQTGWSDIMVTGTFPPTTYSAKVRLLGTANAATLNWDDVVIYWNLQTRLPLPTWVTQWRTEEGEEALRIYQQANRLGSIDSWSAQSYDLALVDPRDYQLIQQPSAAGGIGLTMEMSRDITSYMPNWPMIIEARRPFSDFGVLAAETDVTACPLRLVVAAAKCLAGLERRELNDRLPMWQHDFIREQQRVASLLQTPAVDNAKGQAWQVLK